MLSTSGASARPGPSRVVLHLLVEIKSFPTCPVSGMRPSNRHHASAHDREKVDWLDTTQTALLAAQLELPVRCALLSMQGLHCGAVVLGVVKCLFVRDYEWSASWPWLHSITARRPRSMMNKRGPLLPSPKYVSQLCVSTLRLREAKFSR